jgi:sialic acid synthase SpsE
MDFESRTFEFGAEAPCIVIAEIGVNHNGRIELAKRMVDSALQAGADVIKFQAFISEKEISRYAPTTPYQAELSAQESQLELCKALELSPVALREMKAYCDARQAPFLCAAFDYESVDLLADDLKVKTIKVASSEVTNLPFLEYIGSKKTGVILSTGASNLMEVGHAIEALRRGGCPELVLFQCISSYPAPYQEVNLRVMQTLRDAFSVPVGFSDHTIGPAAGIAAAALGACAIEKHFTLDRTMEGPDHRSSIEPAEFKKLVDGVRIAHQVLGDGIKRAMPCELENKLLIRKSIVAAHRLQAGTRLRRDMVEFKRPADGIEPADVDKIMGLVLKVDLEPDQPVTWAAFA